MPPTTSPRRNIAPEGRAAAGRIAEFRQNVNNGQTSAQARATVRQIEAGPGGMGVTSARPNPMRVTPPDTIASTDLASNTTFQDVLNRRGELEQQAGIAQQVGQGYDALMGRIGTIQSPLTNPEDTINRLLLNRPTETQNALDTAMGNQAQGFRQFAGQYEEAGQQAREDLGVGSLQSNLAETRNRIAERTNMLRQTLRDFETNAERRGVAREFVQSEKQAVQAEAAAELADLAIIESAQLGNLQQAQQEVDRILQEKAQAFEFENMAIEQEIARLEKMDSREAETRKTQLEIALQERNRNIQVALENERETRNFMVQAAANGADNGTLDAIRRSTTPGEAALLAGPWIGRLDRMQAQASIRASNASAALNEAELQAFNKAQEDAAAGILTGDQVEIAQSINKDFEDEPIVKSYNEGLQSYIVLEDTIANGIDGIEDMQLVYAFMKSVDPQSVVRETEFENAAKTGNIFQGAFARFNGAVRTGGFLPENVKQDFIRAARASFEAKNTQYFNVKSEKARQINQRLGITNGANYLTAYESAAPLSQVDFGLAETLSGATPEDIQEIMLMSEQMYSTPSR